MLIVHDHSGNPSPIDHFGAEIDRAVRFFA